MFKDPAMEDFRTDRFEAFMSLNETKIKEYMIRWGEDPSDFHWSSVHLARILLPEISEQEKIRSIKWLFDNGHDDILTRCFAMICTRYPTNKIRKLGVEL